MGSGTPLYLVWSGLVDGLFNHSETSVYPSSIHLYESFRSSVLGISIIMKPLFLVVCVSQLCGHDRVNSPELYLKIKI